MPLVIHQSVRDFVLKIEQVLLGLEVGLLLRKLVFEVFVVEKLGQFSENKGEYLALILGVFDHQ